MIIKEITDHPSFHPVKDEINIFTTGGEKGDDFDNLLNAARKAVEHGYRALFLPNQFVKSKDYIKMFIKIFQK